MGLRIILRRRKEYSPFRRALLSIIGLPQTDSLILCSGYIYEHYKYRISQDQLATALASGCQGGTITVIAGKLDRQWEGHYMRFLESLRAAGLRLCAYKVPSKNWHAKIAIKLRDDEPVAAIIGSSNLTRPAYADNPPTFNYECDVIIWQEQIRDIIERQFAELETDPHFDRWEAIDAVLAREQPNEEKRLKKLYEEIIKIIRDLQPIEL